MIILPIYMHTFNDEGETSLVDGSFVKCKIPLLPGKSFSSSYMYLKEYLTECKGLSLGQLQQVVQIHSRYMQYGRE